MSAAKPSSSSGSSGISSGSLPADVLVIVSSTLSEFFDSNPSDTIITSSKILTTLLQNAIKTNVTDPKKQELYRKIRLENPKIQKHIAQVDGALDILSVAGFVEEKQGDKTQTTAPWGDDYLVYRPHHHNSKLANALELYLEEDGGEQGEEKHPLPKQPSLEQQQQDLIHAICHGLDVKVKELLSGSGSPYLGTDAAMTCSINGKPTTLTAPAAATKTPDDSSSSSSPFLNDEERRLRIEKIKAMKKAKKEAQAKALEKWEEDKQDRKMALERREALLQAKVQADAAEPVGVTIRKTITKEPLPLAKPMEPATTTDPVQQQKEALVAAARARHERMKAQAGPAAAAAAVAASTRATNPHDASTTGTTPAAAAAGPLRVVDHSMDDTTAAAEEDKRKPAAKQQTTPAPLNDGDATMEDAASSGWSWDEFLEQVPRSTSAEGIRESSCFVRYNNDQEEVPNPKCIKRLFKELDGLNQLLPGDHNSSIWLRFDEESPQYCRALIAAVLPGPTPYSGGLFAFDIYVPGDYPNVCPKIKLISRGPKGQFAFGPHFYSNGTVCLSLLGNAGTDHWIPGHSTLYQVLVSIQGLLLGVEHPYYLARGGWDKDYKEGEFQVKGQTLTGKTVTEEVGVDIQAVLYEDTLRVGTVRYTMLEPLASFLNHTKIPSKKKKNKGAAADNIWEAFHSIIQAHFCKNRITILGEVRKWMSDQLYGRDRSAIAAGTTFTIDELNRLLPKLQGQLSKLPMPSAGSDEIGSGAAAAAVEESAPAEPATTATTTSSSSDDNKSEGNKVEAMAMEDTAAATSTTTTGKKRVATRQASKEDEQDVAMMDDDTTTNNNNNAEKKKNGDMEYIEEKRQRMQAAADNGNYVLAGQLQEEVKRLEQLHLSIVEAAHQQDFIRAGRLQAQFKALTTRDGGTPRVAQRAAHPRQQQQHHDDDDDAMSEDEEMADSDDEDDDSDEEEDETLGEAVANHPGFGRANNARARAAAMGGMGVQPQPHGLGRNVFAPPGHPARMVASNHSWGTGSQLSAPPAAAAPSQAKKEAPVAAKNPIPRDRLCRLRIRLPADKSVVEDFEKSDPLSAVYRRLAPLMPEAEADRQAAAVAPIVNGTGAFAQPLSSAGFTLLLTRPKREFSLEMHGTKSLDELNLAPSATLTVMKCSDRGILHRGELESRLRQAQGDALDVDGLTYEGLVELTERVGAATPADGSTFMSLSREELENNSKTFSPSSYLTELDNSMEEHGEDERRCPICLGEYDQEDITKSLRKLTNCKHIFHSACLETWLRTKSSCPLCKNAIRSESS